MVSTWPRAWGKQPAEGSSTRSQTLDTHLLTLTLGFRGETIANTPSPPTSAKSPGARTEHITCPQAQDPPLR